MLLFYSIFESNWFSFSISIRLVFNCDLLFLLLFRMLVRLGIIHFLLNYLSFFFKLVFHLTCFLYFLFLLILNIFRFIQSSLVKCPLFNSCIVFWRELISKVLQYSLTSSLNNWPSYCLQRIPINLNIFEKLMFSDQIR